jgi:hypothetical protein
MNHHPDATAAAEPCPGCFASLPVLDGPTHRYIGASAACWDRYTRRMAGDPPLPQSPWSGLVVDSYSAQHPGDASSQATQSVACHLVTLSAILEGTYSVGDAIRLRVAAVEVGRKRGGYPKLEPVPDHWAVTVADLAAASAHEREDQVDRYPGDVLRRWADLHGDTIERWRRAAVSALA